MPYTARLSLSILCVSVSIAFADTTPIDSYSSYDNGEGTGWSAIGYSNPSLADPASDQQTGGVEGDLVGDGSTPFFYTAFDDHGTGDLRDGTISFRTRHGGDSNPPGFKGALTIGIDANGDSRIDGFIGVDNSGQSDGLFFWNADNVGELNNTSISSLMFGSIYSSYTETATNYNYREVETADLGVGATLDFDGDAGAATATDTYLSFSFDFLELITFLEASSPSVSNLNEETAFRYIVGTATQGNSYNQDTGGINGTTGETLLFSDPNSPVSNPYSATGEISVVPEPSSISLLLGACSLLLIRRNRKA